MADIEPVLDAISEYAAQREAEGAASRQEEINALRLGLADEQVARAKVEAEYEAHMRTHAVTPPPPPPGGSNTTIIGMSSPKPDWDTRLQQVGRTGVTARRIFADLNSDASDQMDLVDWAHRNQFMPVFSFKVPSMASAATGQYDAWVKRLGDRLASYGKQTTVTFWHEPYGDDGVTAADFVKCNQRFAPLLKSSNVKFGPFLNGWLLDRQVNAFKTFTSPDLLKDGWDWLGIDTYESGTMTDPGVTKPAARIPLLVKFCADNGIPGKPLGVGEYNGYSAATIAAAGDAILATQQVWFGCMWNATTGKGYVLEGARLDAFKKTLADTRTRKV